MLLFAVGVISLNFICQVAWFKMERVWSTADDGYVETAVGTLCEIDGICCEVWPLMSVADIQDKLRTDPKWKKGWYCVRAGVSAAGARTAQRNEKVFRNDTTGFVMSRKMAFVREAEYETKVGQAIPQADLLILPGYDRVAAKVRGTVFEIKKLPKDVKYETVKVYSSSARCHDIELLPPSRVFRAGQAKDRFMYSIAQHDLPFRGPPCTGSNFVDVKALSDEQQHKLALKNCAEQRNAGASAQVEQTCRSSLKDASDEEEDLAPAVSVTKSRAGGAAAVGNGSSKGHRFSRKPGRGGVRQPMAISSIGSRRGNKRKAGVIASAESLLQGISENASVLSSPPSSRRTAVASEAGDEPEARSARKGDGVTVVSLLPSTKDDTMDITEILNGARLGRQFRSVQALSHC